MKRGEQIGFEVRMVPDLGEIGAGRVLPFKSTERMVPVMVPSNAPADAALGRMTVRGLSLEDEDIYDGDYLLLRSDITKKDIGPHTICAVLIHTTGELVAKKVLYSASQSNYVTLRASGGGLKDMYFPADEIEIRAIAWGIQRMPDEYGRFKRRRSEDDIPF